MSGIFTPKSLRYINSKDQHHNLTSGTNNNIIFLQGLK